MTSSRQRNHNTTFSSNDIRPRMDECRLSTRHG
jgi:hypothetical protein